MFRRQAPVTYILSEKKMYLSDVLFTLKMSPYAIRKNNRPYDRYKDQKVTTLHYVIRYKHEEENRDRVERLRRHFVRQGFYLQENPRSEKSVDEIDHFHAIQILSSLT